MDKVFEGCVVGAWQAPTYYINDAAMTDIVVDGVAMVKHGTSLVPASEWVGTKTEAKQQIVSKLVKYAGMVQATIDRLRDEILHETLTSEERAA